MAMTGTAIGGQAASTDGRTAPAGNDLQRRYLAVDQTLHAGLRSMEMVMGQARDQRVIFKQYQEAWEEEHGLAPVWAGSIVRDHEGRLRMYYACDKATGEGRRQATALAFSKDGVNWTKPALNIAPRLVDHPASNLINLEPHPGMIDGKWYRPGPVFLDERAPRESRYKLAWRVGDDMYVATSPDGLNFVTHGLAIKHKADTQHSAFYDPFKGEYVIYGRKRGDWETGDPDRRGLPRHSSKNWTDVPWTSVGQVVIDPMDVWDYTKRVRPEVYTPAIQIYHGQYIGLPSIFFIDHERKPVPRPDRKGTGPFYPMVMHSHDGIHWTFPHLSHPIVEIEPHERVSTYEHASFKGKEVGMVGSASNFIEDSDRLLVYYVVREENHYEPCPPDRKSIHVAFMRVDGFASVRTTGNGPGEWITADLPVPQGAEELVVNAEVSGTLKVEVLDAASGAPVDGLSLAGSTAFTGDSTRHAVRWNGGRFQDAAGKLVRLRFVVQDGAIYSFSLKG